jgi:formate hydrogenlyase subunit 3/multisubunit Na+/H+ antiporter MnhD subunit
MGNSLIIFQLMLPIFIGCSFFLCKKREVVYFLGLLVSLMLVVLSLMIFLQVLHHGNIRYHFGGWIPPFGIEFKITKIKAFFTLVFSLVLFVTSTQYKKLVEEIAEEKIPTFYGVMLLCFAGFLGIISTNDFFNIYVFIEVASLTSYSLASMSKNKAANKFALDYLIIGTIAATLILVGIGYLYAASGTLNIDDFIAKSVDIRTSKLVQVGYYFIVIGLCIKAALFPFHHWLVNAYHSTNSFILPFFAGVSSKTYILILFLLNLYVFDFANTKWFFIGSGSLAALVGSLLAFHKKNLRDMLIFSSIAETGYIFIALGIGGILGTVVGMILILNSIFSKVSLFVLSGDIEKAIGSNSIDDLCNLKSKMPVTTLLFALNCFSAIGIPATIGFVAKFSLLMLLFSQQMFLMIFVILLSSVLSWVYNWRFIECFLYKKNQSHNIAVNKNFCIERRYLFSNLILGAIAFLNVVIGIFFEEFFRFIEFLVY